MIRPFNSIVYALCTLVAASLLLAGSSLAVERIRATGAATRDADRRHSRDYLAHNRRAGSHVVRARRLRPGQEGVRMMVIGNDGRATIRRIALYQDQLSNTGFGRALRLQLWDRTTNRCILPAQRERGRCRGWGTWDARDQLRGRRIVPKFESHWRPGERHVIRLRYKLMPWSTNGDQGQSASFRFRWRYLA